MAPRLRVWLPSTRAARRTMPAEGRARASAPRGASGGTWALRLAAAAALCLFLPPGAQSQRSLTLESFTATLEVESSGMLDVHEELRVRFQGSWNGVFRTIPVRYDLGASTHRVHLDVVDVRSGAGESLDWEQSRQGAFRQIKVWVPGASDATHTIVLHYRVRDALRFFESHDELYWNVTGNEWEMPIERAQARVVLPSGATARRAAAYTGAYGERGEDAEIVEVEEGFFFRTTESLAFKEGLTVVVGWDPGVVHRPGLLERAIRAGGLLLLLPFVSLAAMWRLWSARGRDPRRRPITPRYEPPEGLRPAEAGTLVDNTPDLRDLTAGIVDLAVRGYLRIEEKERTGLGSVFGKDEFVFHRLREAGPELRQHERELFDGIFGGRSTRSTTDLEHEFYLLIPKLKRAIFAVLLSEKYYPRRPDKVLQAWAAMGAAALVMGVIGLTVLAALFGWSARIAVLAGLGVGLPVLGFGVFMPARTVKGVRRLEEILGFEEFLDRVESDRFRRMIKGPEQFETYLPYAMAFGVEEQWAKAFEGIYTEPPTWYVGHSPIGFRPTAFVASLDSMAGRTGSAMTSAPRSSSGSGFSGGGGGGGGFSGGGFGGGGGGGF